MNLTSGTVAYKCQLYAYSSMITANSSISCMGKFFMVLSFTAGIESPIDLSIGYLPSGWLSCWEVLMKNVLRQKMPITVPGIERTFELLGPNINLHSPMKHNLTENCSLGMTSLPKCLRNLTTNMSRRSSLGRHPWGFILWVHGGSGCHI